MMGIQYKGTAPATGSSALAGANELVSSKLDEYLCEIGKRFNADCLAYFGPIAFSVDDFIRNALEEMDGKRKRRLVFILETQGGYAETAKRIADTIRHHYRVVDFLIPGHALSAGTILAMSGDAIHMDYYSVLGPIDPQVPSPEGNGLVPALGYLLRYEELLTKAKQGELTTAEAQILLSFDQRLLYAYEQARDLSISLLEEWLVKYKFKNWRVTAGRKARVTKAMKRKRAIEIAMQLNDVKKWNSHGMGISAEVLRRVLKLQIDDFGAEPKLHQLVRCYHSLLTDFKAKMSCQLALHTRGNLALMGRSV